MQAFQVTEERKTETEAEAEAEADRPQAERKRRKHRQREREEQRPTKLQRQTERQEERWGTSTALRIVVPTYRETVWPQVSLLVGIDVIVALFAVR